MTTNTNISWMNVFIASIVATLVVTLTFAFSGNDIVKALGMMILGGDASAMFQYTAGGIMHLAVGIGYGVLFAIFFASVQAWSKLTKGVIFGFVITAVALTLMPVMAAVVAGSHSAAANTSQVQNPCNAVANPCGGEKMQPCGGGMKNPCAMNACNPCSGHMDNPCATNPCSNPCAPFSQQGEQTRTIAMTKPGNPCAAANNPCAAANPCSGSNPCGGSGGGNAYAGLISLLNHLAFGLTLSFMVRVSRSKAS